MPDARRRPDRHQRRGAARRAQDRRAPTTVTISTRPRSWSWTPFPSHLLVLGGGYIGLEFGQMFRRFGSPGDGRPARQAPARPRGRRHRRRRRRHPARGRHRGPARERRGPGRAGRRGRRRDGQDAGRRADADRLAPARRRGPHPEHRPAQPGRGRHRNWTSVATSRSTSGWRRTCPASTRSATSTAARPSPTSPTTTSASCAPT